MVKNMKRKPYIIALFFFLIDFFSKQIVIHTLTLNEGIPVIKNFFYLTYTQNTGAAFSILKDQRLLLLFVTIIVLFLINQVMNKNDLSKIENLTFGMIIGGIVGNLLDRVINHYVIDFLDFRFFGYHYPIFNLADTFIVVGIILLVIINFRKDRLWKK